MRDSEITGEKGQFPSFPRRGVRIFLLALLFALNAYAAGPVAATLVDAAKNKDKEAMRALLRQRADVNLAEPDGTTALQWAAHWNDLETVDLQSSLADYQRYSLVVHVSDLSRRALVRLPWDYSQYGKEAGQQRVVDAVRASISDDGIARR